MTLFFAGVACGALGMLGFSFLAAASTSSPHGRTEDDLPREPVRREIRSSSNIR